MTRKTLLTLGAAATVAVIAAAALAAGGHRDGPDGWGGARMMMMDHGGPGMMHRGGRGPMGMADSPVFRAFDTDGDGTVSAAEAETGLAGLLATHDADGDGSLSRAEFDALFAEAMGHRAARPFAMLDSDGNDRIDAAEMQFPARMMQRMQRMHGTDGPAE